MSLPEEVITSSAASVLSIPAVLNSSLNWYITFLLVVILLNLSVLSDLGEIEIAPELFFASFKS